MSSSNIDSKNPRKSSKEIIFKVLRQISYTKLFKKYTSGKFSYSKISVNHLIYSDTCEIVARFKDFLIYDDNTEFIRRFYPAEEANPRLKKILIFYETYSKIFPNYLVLKENKYLYRNIRKKQKMINAINEIKKEEKENKKKLGIKSEKNDENFKKNELFTKKIKDEIKIFQKNLCGKIYKNSFDTDNQNEEDTLLINNNSISISILNWKEFEKNNFDKINEKENNKDIDSFITNKTNESITKMLSILNDNKIYIRDLPKIFMENKNLNQNVKKQNIKINKKNIHNGNKKTKYNKNEISNYAKTSFNATSSSTFLSKKIQKRPLASSNNRTKDNENRSNNIKINVKDKKLISKKFINNNNSKNINNNIYQPMSPQMQGLKFRKQFFYTNNNHRIQNTPSNKNKDSKFNKKIISNDNNTEKKEIHSNSNIKKNNIKKEQKPPDIKPINKYNKFEVLITNHNTKEFITEDNQNLMTSDIMNKHKKADGKKVNVNMRDIINGENNKKDKKIFNSDKKVSNNGGLILNFKKNKTSSFIPSNKLKFYENKSQKNINTLANLNCNKYKFNSYRNNSDNSVHGSKTEGKSKNKIKKIMVIENKSKTKSIFSKEKKSLSKIVESNTSDTHNSKISDLKKIIKAPKGKDNLLINSSKPINNEKFPTYENKSKKIKQLTPVKKNNLDLNSKHFDSNLNILNNTNKRIKTISNQEKPNKVKTFLNNKILNKINSNSDQNIFALKVMKSIKNNTKKTPNNSIGKLFKTPDIKNKKVKLFTKSKTITSKKFFNHKIKKNNGQSKRKNFTSFTIKVNKTYINKKNQILKKEKSKVKEKGNNINSELKTNIAWK